MSRSSRWLSFAAAALVPAFAMTPFVAQAATFLDGVKKVTTLGSTVPDNGDVNPYALLVAPVSVGKIKKGDVLVDNFNDKHNLQEFSQAVRSFPEVMECHVVLGVYDFLLRVVAADMDAYHKFFFDKLSKIPNIREVNSFVAVSEIKSTTALPIRR